MNTTTTKTTSNVPAIDKGRVAPLPPAAYAPAEVRRRWEAEAEWNREAEAAGVRAASAEREAAREARATYRAAREALWAFEKAHARDIARARIARGADAAWLWDVALGGDGDGEFVAWQGVGDPHRFRQAWKGHVHLLDVLAKMTEVAEAAASAEDVAWAVFWVARAEATAAWRKEHPCPI